jgi:6,7-dimethyl-8-ribityllumazine synthase
MDPTIKGLGPTTTTYDGSAFRIAIVHARWNDVIINSLVKGCIDNIVLKSVPGSYELPMAAKMSAAA